MRISDWSSDVCSSDLAGAEAFAHAPSNDEWEIALHLVQQLGTPGLGARDLKECMILQLNALPSTTGFWKPALSIISDHLDTLARGDYAGLARSLHCSKDDIQAACSLIRSLRSEEQPYELPSIMRISYAI